MMSVFQIILLVVVALILVGLFAYLIRIVPQAKAYVVERHMPLPAARYG